MIYRMMLRLVCLQPGPKANMSERKAAMSAGQKFIKEKGYSPKTQVTPVEIFAIITVHFPSP